MFSVLQLTCLRTLMRRWRPVRWTCWRPMTSEGHHTNWPFPLCPPSSLSSVLLSCRTRPLSAASVGSVAIQERLNQLVSLFKGRTEHRKERLFDPDESEEESPSACMDTPSLTLVFIFSSIWCALLMIMSLIELTLNEEFRSWCYCLECWERSWQQ